MAFPWSDAWPLLILILAVIAVVAIPLGRAMRRRGKGAPPDPVGPVRVPPEEAELVDGPVSACMRCGSTEVGLGSVLQGSIPGAGDQFAYVCKRCRHRGPALEFDTVTAYRQFIKGLNETE